MLRNHKTNDNRNYNDHSNTSLVDNYNDHDPNDDDNDQINVL